MTNIYRHDFIICPWCEEQSGCRVDHLYDGSSFAHGFGPWYCAECRKGFTGKVNSPGDVDINKYISRETRTRSMALLKLDGKEGPVFFVMDHDRYNPTGIETDQENQEHQKFFFESHSCPTNWLRECVAVIDQGDADPHGFLEFVRAVDVPTDFDSDDDDNWHKLFPEAF